VSAVKGVAAGTVHTCAAHADGKVSCWGYGAVIGPGLPSLTPPVTVDLPGRAAAVAVGIQAACALLEIGQVHCWGDFGKGAEGPAPVVKEDGTPLDQVEQIAGGSVAFCAVGKGAMQTLPAEVLSIAAGAYHTCALVQGGAAWCWGSNEQGECGSPSSAPVFSPAAVAGVRARAVAIGAGAGAQHTCVVLDDGSVSC